MKFIKKNNIILSLFKINKKKINLLIKNNIKLDKKSKNTLI